MAGAQLAPKQLQLFRELLPNALFGVLADPAIPDIQPVITALQTAARMLRLQLFIVNARNDSDLETAFETFSERHIGGVPVSNSTLFVRRRELEEIGGAIMEHEPTPSSFRDCNGQSIDLKVFRMLLAQQIGPMIGQRVTEEVARGAEPGDDRLHREPQVVRG